jgi:hypothetical protein
LNELREALPRSESRESELTEALEEKLRRNDGAKKRSGREKPENYSTTKPWRLNVDAREHAQRALPNCGT